MLGWLYELGQVTFSLILVHFDFDYDFEKILWSLASYSFIIALERQKRGNLHNTLKTIWSWAVPSSDQLWPATSLLLCSYVILRLPTITILELRKNFPGWVVGSAENKASTAPNELGLGLSLAITLLCRIQDTQSYSYYLLFSRLWNWDT